MPFQPVPNSALIEWIYLIHGQLCENTYHVEYAAPPTALELGVIAEVAYNWWASELGPTLSTDVTLLRTEAKGLDDITSPFATYVPGVLSAGGAGVPAAANNVAFVIKHTTAIAGRSGRGRWYVVGIPHTLVVDSNISIAQAALYTAAFPLLDTALDAESANAVVVSRKQNGDFLPIAVTYPITGHTFTDTVTDSQRRRLPGRGS